MTNYACLMLPFPGSVNSLWRCFRNRTVKSKAGRAYEDSATRALETQKPLPYFAEPVSVELAFGPPDKRTRDLDNYAKAVLDALTRNEVLEDDSLIHRLLMYWCREIKCGVRVEITRI